MADIFLSYARRERHQAEPIKVALESLGLVVFFDVDGLDGGDVFPDVLDRELKTAGAVVSLWSPWSLTRPWIKIESRIAKDRGVLIPVDIASIDPLHDLPAAFYDDQRIDLMDFTGDTAHPGWIKLVKSLARTLRRPELLEREARTNVHSGAQADDLRREVEALRAQIGDIATAKAAAASQSQGRKEAFALIDKSISRSDYRRFLDRFTDGAEAFEAERRLDQLEMWAKVDRADPGAISEFLTGTSLQIYPALADEARRVQKQARKAKGAGKDSRLVFGGLGALILAGILFTGIDPLGWRGDEPNRTDDALRIQDEASGASGSDIAEEDTLEAETAKPAVAEPAQQTSQLTAGEVFADCTGCPSMVVVPAGSFTMGSPSTEAGRSDEEGPQRTVTIGSDFAVGRYEVTWAEWDACVADGGCGGYTPKNPSGWSRGRNPVMRVSWDDAQAYVSWLSRKTGKTYRVLSEAEWEYAARAGTTTPFSFGSTISTSQANYDGNYTYGSGVKGENRQKTTAVGSFSANAFGLYDMHGNVWEWTQDCWNYSYSGAPKNGSAWTNGNCSFRVLRGGSWDMNPQELRSAARSGDDTSYRASDTGFRVARTL